MRYLLVLVIIAIIAGCAEKQMAKSEIEMIALIMQQQSAHLPDDSPIFYFHEAPHIKIKVKDQG